MRSMYYKTLAFSLSCTSVYLLLSIMARLCTLEKGLLLLLLHISLLQPPECTATLAITEAPSSQVVELGDSASFHCAASGGDFHWIVRVPSLESSLIISQTGTLSEYGITAEVSYEFNTAIQEYEYTSTLAVEGRVGTNNTELYCEVTTFGTNRASSTVELTVIGTPDSPVSLTIQLQLNSLSLSATWRAPFAHVDHAVSHYILKVVNTRSGETYDRNIVSNSSASDVLNTTMPFTSQTEPCDVLTVSLVAVNDIGESDSAVANISIPTVPDDEVSVGTSVYFEHDGSPVIILDIEFPRLCSFQRLNYTVILTHLERGSETVLRELEGSVMAPSQPVQEEIRSVELNTDYSVVVLAETDVWNTSTHPHNLSTYFRPTTATDDMTSSTPVNPSTGTDMTSSTPVNPSAGTAPPKSGGTTHLILGIAAGSAGVILLLIIIAVTAITLMCVMRSCKRKTVIQDIDEELKAGSVPYDLTPNPIYDGPVYDTIREPFNHLSSLKLRPPAEPVYSDSPSHHKQRHQTTPAVSEYEELNCHRRETEDCYVHMQPCKRQ